MSLCVGLGAAVIDPVVHRKYPAAHQQRMQKTAVIHQKLPQVFLITLGHVMKHDDYHLTALDQNIFHSEIIAHGSFDPRRVDQRQSIVRAHLEQHIHRGSNQPPVLLLGRVGGCLPGRIAIVCDKDTSTQIIQLRKLLSARISDCPDIRRFQR